MRTSRRRHLAGVVSAALLAVAAASGLARAVAGAPDHSDYDRLLRKYVTKTGVRYAAWRADDADRLGLKRYMVRMENVDVDALRATPTGREAVLAFWINLYNAATLDLVLEDYPVKTIKELGGAAGSPWQRNVTASGGHALSLDQIENEIIRPTFHDPRVHFALNCAARSCPPLRAGAYLADSLEAQLDEQTRAFLSGAVELGGGNPSKVRLPKIFDWYAKDFGASDDAVVAWLRPWVSALAALPDSAKVDVKYADYDWTLNVATER
ncbi:MAG: DUF547 domain-containing protein [bacterium]